MTSEDTIFIETLHEEKEGNPELSRLFSEGRFREAARWIAQRSTNPDHREKANLWLRSVSGMRPETHQPATSQRKANQQTPNPCTPVKEERWGIRFSYEVGGEITPPACNRAGPPVPPQLRHWYMTLLPAMESVMASRGGRDVPGATPGLQFKIMNNLVKHRIPGYQPVLQNMGIETMLITLVGTFTGDGGLGHIEHLGTKQQIGDGTFPYPPGNGRYGNQINPIFNPIYNVWNRGVYSKIRENNPGNAWDAMDYPPRSYGNAAILSTDTIRQGMFERDGCFGQCPIPVRRSAFNKDLDYGEFDVSIGNSPDPTQHYTIGYLSAYLDAYKEFSSFYQLSMQQGKELKVEINLRKSRDGLLPEAKYTDPRYIHDYSSFSDPIRDNETGNVVFKGFVRQMEVYAARSDRVWYKIEFEVSDHGMKAGGPVNLTPTVDRATNDLLKGCAEEEKETQPCTDAGCEAVSITHRGDARVFPSAEGQRGIPSGSPQNPVDRETSSAIRAPQQNIVLVPGGGGYVRDGQGCTNILSPAELASRALEINEGAAPRTGNRSQEMSLERNTLTEMYRTSPPSGAAPDSSSLEEMREAWEGGTPLSATEGPNVGISVTPSGHAIRRYGEAPNYKYTFATPNFSSISKEDAEIVFKGRQTGGCKREAQTSGVADVIGEAAQNTQQATQSLEERLRQIPRPRPTSASGTGNVRGANPLPQVSGEGRVNLNNR